VHARLALVPLAVILAGCGSKGPAAQPVTTSQQPPVAPPPATNPQSGHLAPALAKNLVASLSAPTHAPRPNAPWHYVVRASDRRSGKPVDGAVHVQVLESGRIVNTIGWYKIKHGLWEQTIKWPASNRGHDLVFQAELQTAVGQRDLNYPISVR
jgi:predicted small lipoprotein YifL